ncbi:inositol-trisphosphate 3-kinase B-like [Salarias fasciatus]|uniref:Kinase n=1 Tax=Salarias fasciatus TaxID=181472 RepID=A0A672FJX6_SALFA|nr:inositol-trisphosphate 3-kinase B-like [Salarias fasciatus]
MEIEPEETGEDSSTRDPTLQHLLISQEPLSGCRVRSRSKLQTTKSYPPYSQCIGGLGEDGDSRLDSELSDAFQPSGRHTKEENHEEIKGAEKKEDFSLIARSTRNDVKAKWRSRRKEKSRKSQEDDDGSYEREWWNGGKGAKATGKERQSCCGESGENGEILSFDEYKDERRGCPAERGVEEKEEEAEENPGMMQDPTSQVWSSPHPILSRLLHSSTSSSSCSSINLSSAESDNVFSEEEDAATKRKTFRKHYSWKSFVTLMHWSAGRQRSWVQLAGHQGNLQLSKGGEVLKLYSEVEATCLESLMKDTLRPFVPRYHGTVTRGEHCYMRLEDLLSDLRRPLIMDCKMGVRTYQEEEVIRAHRKATLRSDLYQKMVKIDASAPSTEEHERKGVTKWRYLLWKDTTSSTATLGLRIEGIMMEDGSILRNFRRVQTLSHVTETLLYFTRSQLKTLEAYRSRLLALTEALKTSEFFRTHEVIGSSLLFVHDGNKANVWMIDFGKTTPLPDSRELQHDVSWVEGSKEDGYLIGLTSLISSLTQAISTVSWQQAGSTGAEKPGS